MNYLIIKIKACQIPIWNQIEKKSKITGQFQAVPIDTEPQFGVEEFMGFDSERIMVTILIFSQIHLFFFDIEKTQHIPEIPLNSGTTFFKYDDSFLI